MLPPGPDAQAVRLNNNGVALMNQQQTERAEAAFAEASRRDPALAEAALNDGIALLYMQKLTEAEASLKRAAALKPADPARLVQPRIGAARWKQYGQKRWLVFGTLRNSIRPT